MLTDALTSEEAEFYLHIDRLYLGFDVRTGETVDEEAELLAGGLTDLLQVIGHCEPELTVGTMDRTKRQLLSIPDAASLRSYYQAVGRPCRRDVDAALVQDQAALAGMASRGRWSQPKAA